MKTKLLFVSLLFSIYMLQAATLEGRVYRAYSDSQSSVCIFSVDTLAPNGSLTTNIATLPKHLAPEQWCYALAGKQVVLEGGLRTLGESRVELYRDLHTGLYHDGLLATREEHPKEITYFAANGYRTVAISPRYATLFSFESGDAEMKMLRSRVKQHIDHPEKFRKLLTRKSPLQNLPPDVNDVWLVAMKFTSLGSTEFSDEDLQELCLNTKIAQDNFCILALRNERSYERYESVRYLRSEIRQGRLTANGQFAVVMYAVEDRPRSRSVPVALLWVKERKQWKLHGIIPMLVD